MAINQGQNSDVFIGIATFTRPANTTAYAVGDAVSDSTSSPSVIEFANTAETCYKSLLLQEVTITSSVKAATLPQFKLWLFNDSPTAINDNAAFSLSDTENNTAIARILVTSSSTATLNATVEATDLRRIMKAGSTSIFGLLEATNAYTPSSGEIFTLTIKGIVI